MIPLLLADEYPVVRAGLTAFLAAATDIAVVGQAGSGPQALELALEHKPDVLLTELRLPGFDADELLRRLKAAGSPARVLVFTRYDCDCALVEAIDGGACGYLLKTVPPEEILRAIRLAAAGGALIDGVQVARMMRHIRAAARPLDPLTERERGVLQLMVRGLRNKEISDQLGIAERTVKFHTGLIYQKLGVAGRAEAVAAALTRNLIAH